MFSSSATTAAYTERDESPVSLTEYSVAYECIHVAYVHTFALFHAHTYVRTYIHAKGCRADRTKIYEKKLGGFLVVIKTCTITTFVVVLYFYSRYIYSNFIFLCHIMNQWGGMAVREDVIVGDIFVGWQNRWENSNNIM